jgi:hypothetical protein
MVIYEICDAPSPINGLLDEGNFSHILNHHVRQHRYSNRGRTPSVTTHTTRSKINTPMFDVVKPLQGNIHGPNQRSYLEQFINEKKILQRDFTREVLTIDHWQMTLHAL